MHYTFASRSLFVKRFFSFDSFLKKPTCEVAMESKQHMFISMVEGENIESYSLNLSIHHKSHSFEQTN